MHRRFRSIAGVAALAVVAGTLGSVSVPAPATATRTVIDPAAGTARPAASTSSITLVTGDRVYVEKLPGGRQAATIRPGKGREQLSFHHMEVDGDLYVIPEDALPYVGEERLDRDLFNVTTLLEQGYDDASMASIPLIVTYREGVRSARVPTAADAGPVLESVDGRALGARKADAGRFWASVTGPSARWDGGIERIWLDGVVEPALDRSVPQIGAPEVWEAGYDGEGVTVAVLDTGVDGTHPALEGKVKAAENFTDNPTVDDRVGHGTHVASIVAGDGERKGVAPKADLLAGKVLNDSGKGYDSWILDGMEWAVESGADVVNLSLGGDPTDGTDPLSAGLDALAAESGTLFVVSAGNDGQDFTIGSPGAASSALTVGAVDRDEALAEFSSRGPRVGDFAVKPDITAPGVGIVAARAAGTFLGTPVDEHHTAASGTSMAAPHVAGAAALLAQRYPDLTGPQLKDALASTAARHPELSVFAQGGGRVDVPRAVEQGVFATGTLDLGQIEDGAASQTREVTYTNRTDQAVTLELDVALADTHGEAPAEGAVGLGDGSITVPAGSTATTTITVDPAKVAAGRYGGYLTATGEGGIVAHTSVGLVKEAPRHTVTIEAVGRDGEPAFVNPLTLNGEDARFDYLGYLPVGAKRTLEVAEGTYYLYGVMDDDEAPNASEYVVQDPDLEVTKDMTVVLDARKANRVRIETPKPAVQRGVLSFHSYRDFGPRSVLHGQMEFDGVRNVHVTPTSKVTDGEFEFGTRWALVAPMLTMRAKGTKGRDDFSSTPAYLHRSPALEGTRRLSLVDVGAGDPDDYEGKDVGGKVVLIDSPDDDYEGRTATAAAAGAALAIIVVPPGGHAWAVWQPLGDRLPTMSVLVTREEGAQLKDLLAAGRVRLDLHGQPSSPYLYDVQQLAHGRVPEQVVHRVTEKNSATVTTSYYEPGGNDWSKEQRFAWRPWQETAINQYQRIVRTPSVRQEIISAGDTLWQHRVKSYFSPEAMNPLVGGMTQAPRTYRPGERGSESWFAPVARPAIPAGVPGSGSVRDGDTMRIRIPEWADGQPGHYGRAEGDWGGLVDEVSARWYRDGELASEEGTAWGDFPAVRERARYRLELDVRRDWDQWEFGTSTRTAWTFESARPKEPELLPLLQLDYDLPTDLRNRVASGRPYRFEVTPRHQDGLRGPRIEQVSVSVSYDDGETWQRAAVRRKGFEGFAVSVRHPKVGQTNGYVALRTEATDAAGNRVEQTVLRAYGLR